MIQLGNYNMRNCEPHLEQLTQTCVDILSDYKKALDKKNITTIEHYQLRGRLEDGMLKVTMLEANLKLVKDIRLLNEIQLDVALINEIYPELKLYA